jgi:hypothetical protein
VYIFILSHSATQWRYPNIQYITERYSTSL